MIFDFFELFFPSNSVIPVEKLNGEGCTAIGYYRSQVQPIPIAPTNLAKHSIILPLEVIADVQSFSHKAQFQ